MKPLQNNLVPSKWYKGLDSLRLILALVVLISHVLAHPAFQAPTDNDHIEIYKWLKLSFNGTGSVIAFFILSGFLIHITSKEKPINLKEFYAKRFIRILGPLAIIVLAGYQFGHPEKAIVWSLICELIYYLLYPFMVVVKLTWKKKLLISFVVALMFIPIFSFNEILAMLQQSSTHYHGYYWQLGPFLTWIVGLPCWLLGVLIAENTKVEAKPNHKNIYALRATVILASILLNLLKETYFVSFIISMNFFALLCYFWIKSEIVYFQYAKPISLFENLGKASYSIYICHPIVILIVVANLKLDVPNGILTIVVVLFISYLFYLLVEKQFHLLAKKIGNRLLS